MKVWLGTRALCRGEGSGLGSSDCFTQAGGDRVLGSGHCWASEGTASSHSPGTQHCGGAAGACLLPGMGWQTYPLPLGALWGDLGSQVPSCMEPLAL